MGTILGWVTKNPAKVLLILAVLAVGVMAWRLSAAQSKIRDQNLELTNLEALADTTELVETREDRNTWRRRAEQVELERDDLDKRLRERPVVTVQGEVRIDTVYADTSAVVQVQGNVRRARFDQYREPVTLGADVEMSPTQAQISWTAAIDPLLLVTSVACSDEELEGGVRRAAVRIEGPSWASINIDSAQQDPGVCSPRPRSLGFNLGLDLVGPVLDGAATGAAVVALTADDPRLKDFLWGAGVGIGTKYLQRFLGNLLPF